MTTEGLTKQPFSFKAYMLLFLICNAQIGVGIFGFQRFVYKAAQHDAWISVILAGIATHISVWIMVTTLRKHQSLDLYEIHQKLFGRWIGGGISILFLVYFLSNMTTIIRTYIEALQSWIFPDFPTWLLSLILIILTVYGSLGGIRVVLQLSVISLFLILSIPILHYTPLEYAVWSRILPIYDTSLPQLLNGAMKMGFTIAGFEAIYFVYKRVKDKENVMKYTQVSVLYTNILHLFIMLVSIVYYSDQQLLKTIWASITPLKIIKYPFLERIEFVVTPLWMFVVLPGLMLMAWMLLRGTSFLFGWHQKATLYGMAMIVFVASSMIRNRGQINAINDYLGFIAISVSYIYPCLLLAITYLAEWRKSKAKAKGRDGG
ncbi:spore germination protein [Paenibacillus sp. N1-5-1-14]|uniref:GerAB/ArcD/ProY family transporter n=1 Tax=Paenibacillus radicibacter TaxID=2972488 RepID=UPI002159421F|nr:spore germination protein [Paenibacillus radicibacter]MCR8641308.1 spore germination protein [Paenibacillus radicibacter]